MPNFILKPLKGKKNFELLFENGKKFYSEQALAIVLFKNEISSDFDNVVIKINYAVSVPKKNCKKAVVRNRIKRLLRVSIKNFFSMNTFYQTNIESFLMLWRDCPQKPSLIRLKDVQPVVFELINKFININ